MAHTTTDAPGPARSGSRPFQSVLSWTTAGLFVVVLSATFVLVQVNFTQTTDLIRERAEKVASESFRRELSARIELLVSPLKEMAADAETLAVLASPAPSTTWKRRLRIDDLELHVGAVDLEGEAVALSDPHAFSLKRPSFQEVLSGKRSHFADLLETESGVFVQVVVPVAVDGGRPWGLLLTALPMASLRDQLEVPARIEHGGVQLLGDGVALARFGDAPGDTVLLHEIENSNITFGCQPDLTELEAATRRCTALLLVTFLATTVIALFVLVQVLRVRFTQPIQRFLADLDGAREDLTYRASAAGHIEEFEELASSFNSLLETREEQQRRLMALNEEMDAEVARRTRELERVVRELRLTNEDLNSFAYIASHDLREPLRGISDFSNFLLEDFGDSLDENGVEMLTTIERNTKRLDGLVNVLLEFSRVGRQDIDRSVMKLDDVCGEIRELLGRLVEDRHVSIVVRNGETPLSADPVLSRQVLVNLVQNGIKYNDSENPEIEVGVLTGKERKRALERCPERISSDAPILFVRDNGIGIPDRYKTRVFEVFRRLHQREQFGGGSGAGLTIARKIARRHGGEVWFDSVEGEGTTFYACFGEEQPRAACA